MERTDHPAVDAERQTPKNPFDHGEGLYGQSYSPAREEALRREDPSGAVNADPAGGGEGAGARASVDPVTGPLEAIDWTDADELAVQPPTAVPGIGEVRHH